MPGARAVLDFEYLKTNDSISGLTISGFSSYKIYRNTTIRRRIEGYFIGERGET